VSRDEGTVILPFPAPLAQLAPVTEIRSTLIASSIQALRAHGHIERYGALLPEQHRDKLLHCIAGQWFPLPVGVAHYQACEELGLSIEQQREIGSDVSHRIHVSVLGVVVKMAKGLGVTPWTALGRGNQLYARILRGGGSQMTKLGPKEAQIELGRLPLLEIPYFRTAALGMYQTAIGLFATRAHVRLVPAQSRAPGYLTTMHASWV
jgi:hypothetical protein